LNREQAERALQSAHITIDHQGRERNTSTIPQEGDVIAEVTLRLIVHITTIEGPIGDPTGERSLPLEAARLAILGAQNAIRITTTPEARIPRLGQLEVYDSEWVSE